MKRNRLHLWKVGLIILLSGVLVACDGEADELPPTTVPAETAVPPTQPAAPDETAVPPPVTGLLISELLVDIPGDNNFEFVELYNAGTEPVNLDGWTLWYHLRADQEPQVLVAWDRPVEVPGWGHYLLARAGVDVGILPDVVFETGLFDKGGLILKDAGGEVVDTFGWGEAPAGAFAGSPAAAAPAGAGLERLPGGVAGNGQNSGDNAVDFTAVSPPHPQNSGSLPTPLPDERLIVTLTVPETVEPGATFSYLVEVTNFTEVPLSDVVVTIPLPPGFELLSGVDAENGRYTWQIPVLEPNESPGLALELQSPFTYVTSLVSGVKAEADGLMAAFAVPRMLSVAGGSIPIATARGLEGSVVTIEGTANMYTGGFFAGSTGTKFYMEDESGGVQVFVPGGNGVVNVAIGDRVRVTGAIELYRDSVELVPLDIETDVEVLGTADMPQPAVITAADNETNDAVLGRLNQIEGMATRIEEFTYSYEVDIIDAEGSATLVYIEKDTGVTAEPLEVGKLYRVTGISEFYSNARQLKPRLQTDIVEVFPPELLVSQSGPISVSPGTAVTFTITAVNHLPTLLTDVVITAVVPDDTRLQSMSDGGELQEGEGVTGIIWTIPELAADGGQAEMHYTVLPQPGVRMIVAQPAVGGAAEWPAPAWSGTFRTFIGEGGVPIWAIQGDDFRSPYVQSEATTRGIVTGVFPELSGFWLQETESDDDPATSAGIFVLVDQFTNPVAAGEFIQVTGRVRELSGQTTLHPTTPDQIEIMRSDQALPQPVAYDPPQDMGDALLYNEAREGMLVEVAEPALVIAPTTRFGEYVLVHGKWGVDTITRTDEIGFTIFVDDGSSAAHSDQSGLPYAVARGDFVEGVVGPLAYTFDHYKIEPLAIPQIYGEVSVLPTLPEVGPNQFGIATFNVENLFDTRDPHPSSPERPSRAEYAQRLAKLADAIQRMGVPTVIGLQEVENIGVLEDLLAQDVLTPYGYEPYLIEGFDSRGIDVAYLVRGDLATVQLVTNEGAPEELFSRPPLLLQTIVHLESADQTVYFLNNHFLSLSGGEEATEPVRTAQAEWNANRMTGILADDPDAHFVVMGDLNSFYQTLPVDTLQAAGLHHAYEFVGEDAVPYTYIFEGRTQSLDHILITDGLFSRLSDVQVLHIDADYPIADPEDASARRLSDHDPLVVIFEWE